MRRHGYHLPNRCFIQVGMVASPTQAPHQACPAGSAPLIPAWGPVRSSHEPGATVEADPIVPSSLRPLRSREPLSSRFCCRMGSSPPSQSHPSPAGPASHPQTRSEPARAARPSRKGGAPSYSFLFPRGARTPTLDTRQIRAVDTALVWAPVALGPIPPTSSDRFCQSPRASCAASYVSRSCTPSLSGRRCWS